MGAAPGWKLSATALALALAACRQPMIEGGQIGDVPEGFGYDGNCSSARRVLPGKQEVRDRCWFTRGEPAASIVVTEYRGRMTAADATAARAQAIESYRHVEYASLPPARLKEPPWLSGTS